MASFSVIGDSWLKAVVVGDVSDSLYTPIRQLDLVRAFCLSFLSFLGVVELVARSSVQHTVAKLVRAHL